MLFNFTYDYSRYLLLHQHAFVEKISDISEMFEI